MQLSKLRLSIEQAKRYHSKLIVVVGHSAPPLLDHAASEDNLVNVNLGLALSERLIAVPRQDRAKAAAQSFDDLLHELNARVMLLTHIEILFDKTLSIEPLKLLQSSAKNLTLVVAWPGEKTTSSLIYAVPSHPEYRNYKASDFGETIFVDAGKNG